MERFEAMKGRLSYANVASTLAVFLSLGAGAYAVGIGRGDVKSRHIANGAVQSVDLADGTILGADVKTEALDSEQIREDRLEVSQFANVASGASACDPTSPVYVACASTNIGVNQRSDILVIVTGTQGDTGAPTRSLCQVTLDGAIVPSSDISVSGGFASTSVAVSVPSGTHTVSLQCNETSGDTVIRGNISVLALDAT